MNLAPFGITRSDPPMPTGTIGTPALSGDVGRAVEQRLHDRAGLALALGEQHQRLAALEHGDAAPQRLAVGGAAGDREAAERRQQPAEPTRCFHSESLPMNRIRRRVTHDAIGVSMYAAVHRGEHERPRRRACSRGPRCVIRHPQPRERRRRAAAHDVVDGRGWPAPAGQERLDLGHRASARQQLDRCASTHLVDASARWCRPRPPRRPRVSGPSARVDVARGRARRSTPSIVVDVAADLGDPALGAHPRRRREVQLQRGVGEHDRCRCRGPRSRRRRARRPTAAGGARSSSRTALLAATALTASVTSRPRISAVASTPSTTTPSSPTASVERLGQRRRPPASSVTGDAAAQGGERHRPVHRPGVEVLEPEPARRAPGRPCSCRRRPGRRWR